MFDCDTILRLSAGLIVAILVHTVLVPTVAVALRKSYLAGPGAFDDHTVDAVQAVEAEREKPKPVPDRPEPTKVAIGRRDEPRRITAAWIPYDDFRELMAAWNDLDQPALQMKVDPVARAPVRFDATDSRRADQPAAGQSNSAIVLRPQEPSAAPPDEGDESTATPAPQTSRVIESTTVPAIAHRAEDMQPAPAPRTPMPPQRVVRAETNRPNTSKLEPVVRPPSHASRENRSDASTAAPRSNRESAPVTRVDMHSRQIGRVAVSKGLELLPVRADPGVVTRCSTAPRDTVGRIMIDRTGRVIQAELLRSTGYGGWDSAILSSLYKWRAEGPMLETIEDRTSIEIYFDF